MKKVITFLKLFFIGLVLTFIVFAIPCGINSTAWSSDASGGFIFVMAMVSLLSGVIVYEENKD